MADLPSLISLGSDNHSGVHPQILQSLMSLSEKYAPSYDTDAVSQELKAWIKHHWTSTDAHLVFNGTAANVLALSTLVKSYHAIVCTDVSHLNSDECGAPEKWLGAKLISVPHEQGKLTVDAVSNVLIRRGDQHCNQIKALSLTQPTELGTVYSLAELQKLREFCDREKLEIHIDGARLANACWTLNCDFADILRFADVATVGGTKNGLLLGELVVIQRRDLNENFRYMRKQAMQLPSKTRFLAQSFLTYLTTPLWKDIARHQCTLATVLEERLKKINLQPNYPVQSNAVFCDLPKAWIKDLREEFFFYVWNEKTFECRLMTSFCTTQEEIDLFATKLETLSRRGAP